ncbi:torsin-1A-interacting protein 2 [Lingula anatina]|uniref:Torsin-1A-interacting protein 2 n=1 Tax=Lingula anatina TaxID=7574 RepID=A0A1S3JRS9_LINAN|nr:torsin-1A-interacting protein 2 [Lingula anatina]XP_013412696.1 torsin-1A-interacting protein 2 [Lingula anatina]XP_013412697.1 torsin-1A-interacting protein 2 [Lingula anatina]|eukprot:XP_013412694.1 torsin-1A-interacting protein 2 [Lingula anatina]
MPPRRKTSPSEDDTSRQTKSAGGARERPVSKTRLQLQEEKRNKLYPDLPVDDDEEEEEEEGDEDTDEVDFLKRRRSGSNSFNSSRRSDSDGAVFEGESPLSARYRETSRHSFEEESMEFERVTSRHIRGHNVNVSGRSSIHSPSSPRSAQLPSSVWYDEVVANTNVWVFCIIILGVIMCYMLLFSNDLKETPSFHLEEIDYEKLAKDFGEKVNLLQLEAPQQNAKTWKILKAATKSILRNPSPEQPAVLLMASTPEGSPTMECLAKKLGNIIHETLNLSQPTAIKTGSYRNEKPDVVKEQIDQILHQDFENGHRAAILDQMQNIPPIAALMLHAYCDNVNAPYKNVVIILTITLETDAQSASELQESSVETFLTKIWRKGLDDDKIGALLSRVANNIVIIKKDESLSC